MTRAQSALLLGVVALVLEGMTVFRFAEFLNAERLVAESLLWHTAAALATGCCMATMATAQHDGQWRGPFMHGFLLCLLLPVAGQVIASYTALCVLGTPAVKATPSVRCVRAPRVVPRLLRQVTYGGGLRLLGRLGDTRLPPDERLQAMVGMREMPSSVSGKLLRELLSDPVEEIRLLAYGIIEAAENRIRHEILVARQLLDAAKSDVEHAQFAARLAELHWELVDQKLVHGELRQFTLRCVRQYGHEALVRDADQGRLWYLLGRSALITSEPEQAREYLLRAQERGFPPNRLGLWLAEADFQLGQYAAVPRSLDLLDDISEPAYEPVKRYWLT